MTSNLRCFYKKKNFSYMHMLNKARGVFNIKPHFSMHGCKLLLFPWIFHYKRTFFRRLLCIQPQKKSLKIKSQNVRTLFSETFFTQDLFSVKITDFETFFLQEICSGYLLDYNIFWSDRFSHFEVYCSLIKHFGDIPI